MKIDSSAFGHQKAIPKKHTGEGEDVSPHLRFSDVPENAKSLALIVDDPDAPMGTFVHWLTWNIPGTAHELKEDAAGPVEGINDFQETCYKGPMPPRGKPHRYFFKLYALDGALPLPPASTKAQLEAAMKGHILAQAEYVGTYQRGS